MHSFVKIPESRYECHRKFLDNWLRLVFLELSGITVLFVWEVSFIFGTLPSCYGGLGPFLQSWQPIFGADRFFSNIIIVAFPSDRNPPSVSNSIPERDSADVLTQ